MPPEQRPRSPARFWALVACALATGGALPDRAALGVAGLLLALVWAMPPGPMRRRRSLVALAAAAALTVGCLRADRIDRSAVPISVGQLREAPVQLGEPLAASSRERSSSARATLEGRRVVLLTPRFGAPSPAFAAGEDLLVTGAVEPLTDRPLDRRLRRVGVAGRVLATRIAGARSSRGGPRGAIDRFARAAQHTYARAAGERRGAVMAGMALGISGEIGQADSDALRTSGLWHLVAASGGNIALVVGLVMFLGWALGAGDRTRLAVSALAICGYVPLAGGGPSIQRAGVMGLAALLALAVGRERRAVDALALAAAATLLVDPRAELDVGWQLSFAAAAGLTLCGSYAHRHLRQRGLPAPLAAVLACTLVATVATAPIMLVTFGQLSLIGLVTNAVAAPLVGIVVWSGAVSALLTPLAPALAIPVALPGGWAAGGVLAIATWADQRSFAIVGPAGAALIVLALGLIWLLRLPRWMVAAGAALAIGVLVFSVPRPPPEPRLVVLDIGQGNAALIQDGTEGVLVDAGPVDGGVVSLLRRTGVRRLRAVILSHPAADHDGGAAAVLNAFPTDLVLDGGTPGGGPTHDADLRAAARHGVRVELVRAGQRLAFGRIQLWLRWPTPRAAAQPGDPNDRAAVVQAQIGRLTAILPADAEGNVLRTLPNLKGQVLIVSHHGSNDDSLPQVLSRMRPQLAAISVGAHNTYGHPTPATLAALQRSGTPTLRTDLSGSIDVRADASGRLIVREHALR